MWSIHNPSPPPVHCPHFSLPLSCTIQNPKKTAKVFFLFPVSLLCFEISKSDQIQITYTLTEPETSASASSSASHFRKPRKRTTLVCFVSHLTVRCLGLGSGREETGGFGEINARWSCCCSLTGLVFQGSLNHYQGKLRGCKAEFISYQKSVCLSCHL